MVKIKRQREMVEWAMKTYQISERRACAVLGVNRTSLRRRFTREKQEYLRKRIREIAAIRVRYGYRRIHVLKREGWQINHKRVYRLYREEGLHLERKTVTERNTGRESP